MTRRAIDDVLDHSKSRLATRLVLIALASYANEAGYAWPGYVKLMRRAGLARSTVWTSLRELLGTGEIRLHDGPVPGREHAVRSYTFLITVSGFEPLIGADGNTVSGFEPLADVDGDDSVDDAAPLQDSNRWPSAASAAELLTSNIRGPDPEHQGSDVLNPANPTPFQDLNMKRRVGTVSEPVMNRDTEVRAGARHVEVILDQSLGDLFERPEAANGVPADEAPAPEPGGHDELAQRAHFELVRLDEAPYHIVITRTLAAVGFAGVDLLEWLQAQSDDRLAVIIRIARSAQREPRA